MASAFLTLPIVFLSFLLEGRTDLEATGIMTTVELFGTIILVGILGYMKRLFNDLLRFPDTNRDINLLICLGAITGILSVTANYLPQSKEYVGNVSLVILILQGIVLVQLGYRLLKLPDDLGGMLKPFCYLNMATGILMASVVLIPLAILVSAVSDLMIGTIFFHMSRRQKNMEQPE